MYLQEIASPQPSCVGVGAATATGGLALAATIRQNIGMNENEREKTQ
jgi:hypothetical protein